MIHDFSYNPQINITRTRFKRPHRVKTTFNAGDIVPINVDEILPGDTLKRKIRKVIRMTTPIKPTMDTLYASVMTYFVPDRLLWNNFKRFQGENDNPNSHWTQPNTYTIPQLTAPSGGWTEGTIADYFGIPTKVGNLSVNALPFRAYTKICNDWFRNQNTDAPCELSLGDSTTAGSNGNNYITDVQLGGKPLKANKLPDYFTTGLPSPQKGPDVLIPLGESAPVYGNGKPIILYQQTTGKGPAKLQPTSGGGTNYLPLRLTVDDAADLPTANGQSLVLATKTQVSSQSNMYADLTNAKSASANEFRMSMQMQRMFEKDARGGTYYIQILRNHFGVISSDARQQRSEYLGGKQIPLNIYQVTQTSSTDTTSPQGNTAGFAYTADIEYTCTKSFEEHGYLITVCVVRAKHTYQQGLNKMWSRKYRTDFYMPTFANIGEQPIYNKEIYAQGSSVVDTDGEIIDDQKFAYQEAWAEYRYAPDIVTGEMRSNATNTQDIWHYADYYASLPTLSTTFEKESLENIDRTLAVQSSSANQFIADFYFDDIMTRPMPLYSIPGLVDHH